MNFISTLPWSGAGGEFIARDEKVLIGLPRRCDHDCVKTGV
ncbi:MAG TPA: hypothetical protein VH678_07570 [Xanthobacteraceae bacterium]|jgi:hypothetical protein